MKDGYIDYTLRYYPSNGEVEVWQHGVLMFTRDITVDQFAEIRDMKEDDILAYLIKLPMSTQKIPFFGIGVDNTQPSQETDTTKQACT